MSVPAGEVTLDVDDGVTDTRRAEALLKTGALERAIFNSANFSSIATDVHGVIQVFNVGSERMLGYEAADVINAMTADALFDPAEVRARATTLSVAGAAPIRPDFEALVCRIERGVEDVFDLTYVRKDGSRLPVVVSVTALRDAQDTLIGYLLIGTDNSARKLVEAAQQKLDQRLRDQQFYTRSLIESNVDALMTTDPEGSITDVNQQMEALTGCTRDELIGAPFKTCFTDPERAEAGIKLVLSLKKVMDYELTVRARDGRETVVSYNASTFHDRERRLQGVFASARDMTELRRVEHALQRKNLELEHASRMKSEFLANMSHELRTPLNAIIGFSEVLRDGLMGAMSEQQRRFIGDISNSGKHLLSLINDILDLSKIEAGKMTLELEPVPVTSLFANSLSIIREKAAARHIRLELEAAHDLGSMRADTRKVKQIVYNLLSNAVKFTERGQVTLRAGRVPREAVGALSGTRPGRVLALEGSDFSEFLEIRVTDSGIGIPPESLEQLFKPFSQIESGLARRFEGSGLGLAMVKLLVELQQGAVSVESIVGAGSCFTVWLPLRAVVEEEVRASVPAAPRGVHRVGPPIALVVEDDSNSAELIRVQLEAEGFMVLHAASAEAALAIAARQPVSLFTIDIMLPHMDGWELLNSIKELPELSRTPVVIISIVADADKGFALGAAAVIQKPFSRQELRDALVAIGLLPLAPGAELSVLVVDDDRKAVELTAAWLDGVATRVLRAGGGREAIELAQRELPDLIVLDLMMPEVNGFEVVKALHGRPETARIPVLVVTAKLITMEDRQRLNGYVTAIVDKADLDPERFKSEIRRAVTGRQMVT